MVGWQAASLARSRGHEPEGWRL